MSSILPTASSCQELIDKVRNRTAKVGIIGMGYVGLPLALLYSEEKFAVTGFDIDPQKVTLSTAVNRISCASSRGISNQPEIGLSRDHGLFRGERMDAIMRSDTAQ